MNNDRSPQDTNKIEKLNGWFSNLSLFAKGILTLAVIVVPFSTTSFALGEHIASKTIADDVAEVKELLEVHVEAPQTHPITDADWRQINKKLCLLLAAHDIQDVSCLNS